MVYARVADVAAALNSYIWFLIICAWWCTGITCISLLAVRVEVVYTTQQYMQQHETQYMLSMGRAISINDFDTIISQIYGGGILTASHPNRLIPPWSLVERAILCEDRLTN